MRIPRLFLASFASVVGIGAATACHDDAPVDASPSDGGPSDCVGCVDASPCEGTFAACEGTAQDASAANDGGTSDGGANDGGPAKPKQLPFPHLALYQYITTDIERLARWDWVVVSTSEFAKFPALRAANPHIKIIVYVDVAEDNGGGSSSPTAPNTGFSDAWWVKNANGSYPNYPWSPGRKMVNASTVCPVVGGKTWVDHLAQWVIANTHEDGVILDILNETVSSVSATIDLDNNGVADAKEHGTSWIDDRWSTANHSLTKQLRDGLGAAAILLGNAGQGFNATNNGYVKESTFFDINELKTYLSWQTNHYGDSYSLLLVPSGAAKGQTDYKRMRANLAVALMGDGYFGYSDGDGPNGGYSALWWYDEYSVDPATGNATGDASHKGYLGYPLGPAKELGNGVWRRDFDNGIALVNESGKSANVDLEAPYRRIKGTQDPTVNSGEKTSHVSLGVQEGLILLR